MCDLVDQEPNSYEEVAQKKKWIEAMMEEYDSIMKNDVWDIVRVAAFHTLAGDVAEIFKPLGVSLGVSLESRLSPCSWILRLGLTPTTYKELLETKNLQNKLRNEPARKYGLENK